MKAHNTVKAVACLLIVSLPAYVSAAQERAPLPEGFVYVDTIMPEIVIELRYATAHNFVGARIDGYLKPKGILTKQAAYALKNVQAELKPFGLGLKLYDGYRPQQAVDHFVRWAKDREDTTMKSTFYPRVQKMNLIEEAYIAAKSSHSRGSTVDVTLVALQAEKPSIALDMGSAFDFFGPESWPHHADLSPSQRAHRMLLHILMKKHGFKPYSKEWWHFTWENEPFPETYFNFPIQ